jgi:recombination protein RecT
MNDHTQHQAPAQRPLPPALAFKRDLEKSNDKWRSLLPEHIRPEKFVSAAMSAINHNPDLLNADKTSLFNALSQSCQDGLLPDNREGALVIHNTKVSRRGEPDMWVAKVAWMPMVRGVLKKIRQSGEVATITLQVVYQGDEFDFWVDDEGEHLMHKPAFDADRSDANIRLAYALVRMKDGELQVEIITKVELEKIRKASKTGAKGYGPWKDWYAQMAKKSALHRLAPKLPISSELINLIQRDDELYDFDQRQERDITPSKPERGRSSRLSQLIDDEEESDANADAGSAVHDEG